MNVSNFLLTVLLFKNIFIQGSVIGTIRYILFKLNINLSLMNNFFKNEHGIGIGIVGSGDYVASTHLPLIRLCKENIFGISSRKNITASLLSNIYSTKLVKEGIDGMISDSRCDSILIATPHNLHADHIIKALKSGKYIYCEKPVGLSYKDLAKLSKFEKNNLNKGRLMVGFNRRFSPAIKTLFKSKLFTNRKKPIEIQYRVNFGMRVNNAMSNPKIGGGRLIGACCHYIDLISYICGSSIIGVSAMGLSKNDKDTFSSIMRLRDGSIASLTFSSDGNRLYDCKELIQITCEGHNFTISDFNVLKIDQKKYTFCRYTYGGYGSLINFFYVKNNNKYFDVSLKEGIHATNVTLAIKDSIDRNGKYVKVKKFI